jgi:CheY-like chemotaxis protein
VRQFGRVSHFARVQNRRRENRDAAGYAAFFRAGAALPANRFRGQPKPREPGFLESNLLPLLLSYAQVAIVDDDPDYVESLALSLPSQYNASLHVHPSTFDEVMSESAKHLHAEQQNFYTIVEAQHETGGLALPLVMRYLASPTRFEITAVALVDYSMPAEDGVSLMARHKQLGLQRILLTGQADNELAIRAFNAGAIEMFLPKQSDDLLDKISAGLDLHLTQSSKIRGQLLSQALPKRLLDSLARPATARPLKKYIDSLGIVEYVMLGRPMGLIGLTRQGKALWIQLEDEVSIASLAELLEEAEWANEDEIRRVKSGKSAVNIEWTNQVRDLQAACHDLTVICPKPFLGAATFPLEDLPLDLRPLFHDDWTRVHGHQRELAGAK